MDRTGLSPRPLDHGSGFVVAPKSNRLSQDTVQALEFIPASDELSGK